MTNISIRKVKDRKPKDAYPRLKDVYSNKKFKEELEDIVSGVENDMLYRCVGTKPPKSFLFEGPPGTGKTFSFKAIANEIRLKINGLVGILEYNIGRYGTAYINMGSVNLQKFFDTGYAVLNDPSNNIDKILYWFDEADALMGKRGNVMTSHKEDDKLLDTLMTNLQDISDRDDNEYVFMATNHKKSMDDASIRTGRIDYILQFDNPDYDSRKKLFDGYIKLANNRAKYKVIRNFNLGNLAKKSKGLSCSDIEAVVNESLTYKIKKEIRKKPKGIIPAYWIGQNYLEESINRLKKRNKTKTKNKIGYLN